MSAAPPTVSVLVPAERRHTNLLRESIPPLFDAHAPLEVVLVHAGPPGTAPKVDPRVRIVEAGPGAGFCRAINTGISASESELVLFGNADLFASGAYVDELVRFLAARPDVACAGGKVLRHDLLRAAPASVLDSTGLAVGRSRRSWDRGEGEPDVGLYDAEEEVFGLSGAGLMIRRDALERARVCGEYLDETFVAYKDDVDLAWRLRRLGLTCWYVPSAVASHARTSHGLGGRAYRAAPLAYRRGEAAKPAYVRRRSLVNQWLLLIKNEETVDFVHDAPWILGREAAGLAYRAATTPGTLPAVAAALSALPTTLRKRRELTLRSVVAPGELRRRWFRTEPRPRSTRA